MIARQEEEQQLQLFYDRPLARGVPEKTLSKNEILFHVWIKNCIQKAYFQNPQMDLDTPFKITIDIGQIAVAKGIKSRSSVAMFKKRMFDCAEELIGQSIPAEWIWEVLPDGRKQKKQFPFYSSLSVTDDGYVEIRTSPDFQKYYILKVLQHPELQVNLDFYMQAKSQYSYGLMNLLLAEVAEQRLGEEDRYATQYHIRIPYEEVYQVIKPAKANYSPSNYSLKVIEKAVEDINNNPFSQIQIEVEKVRGPKLAIIAYDFLVTLNHPVNGKPTFPAYAREELIDSVTRCPSHDYLEKRMKELGVDEPFRKWAWRNRTPMMIACALFHTLANSNNPRYFNAVLTKWKSYDKDIFDYASEVKANHPELVDDVIESITPRKEEIPKRKEELKKENIQSDFLRQFWKKPQ